MFWNSWNSCFGIGNHFFYVMNKRESFLAVINENGTSVGGLFWTKWSTIILILTNFCFFSNHVLNMSRGIEETGPVNPKMAACLLLAWIIVFLCLSKGVQSSGKVVYFTALFPYVVLVSFLLFIIPIRMFHKELVELFERNKKKSRGGN